MAETDPMERFDRSLRLPRRDVQREVNEEIAFHLDMRKGDLVSEGLPKEEAHAQARQAFGDQAGIRRECVEIQEDINRRGSWRDSWESMRRDVRLALRSLSRSPRFAVVLALTLGLGIGATATVFSMLDALLLQPLPYPEGERLGLVFERRPSEGIERDFFSISQYLELAASQESFDLTALFTGESRTLTGEPTTERVGVIRTSSPLFALLGAVPVHGRLLSSEDDGPGAPTRAVLSHGLWQRRYGGNPAVVGSSITLDGQPILVVGVLSSDFPAAAMRLWAGAGDVFLNLSHEFELGIHTVVVRRERAVSWDQARGELDRMAAVMWERRGTELQIELFALRDEVSGAARPALFTMFGAAGILLLITCANAATLLLSRASDREQEVALLSALGAGRQRLFQRAVVEHLFIGLLGAASSVGVVLLVHAALRGQIPDVGSIGFGWLDEWQTLRNVEIDARVLGFTGLVALVSSLFFGLAPAIRASRANPGALLKGEGAVPYSLPVSRWRLTARDILTIGQVALAFTLLVGAGLLVRSFLTARGTDFGFSPDNLLSLYVNPAGEGYGNRGARTGFYEEVLEGLEGVPGVEAAAVVDGLPLTGGVGWVKVVPEGREFEGRAVTYAGAPTSLMRHVSHRYFEAMGIPLVAGRLFDERDREDAPRVVVVDERLASRLWPGEDPIGKRLFEVYGERCAQGCTRGEVVGVVGPVRYQPLEADQWMTFYDLVPQVGDGGHGVYVVTRTTAEPRTLITAVRQEIQSVDSDQPVVDVRTMEERLADTLVLRRLSALVLQTFALLALALALVGLYGTISYGVSRARHSTAVRIALGARKRDVRGLVLRRMLLLTCTGLGLVGSAVLSRLLETVLYGVTPTDPATYITLFLGLLGTASLAAVGPARRAATVDPVRDLRTT